MEGAGTQDRTREHLGYTDRAIVAARRMLLGLSGIWKPDANRRTSSRMQLRIRPVRSWSPLS